MRKHARRRTAKDLRYDIYRFVSNFTEVKRASPFGTKRHLREKYITQISKALQTLKECKLIMNFVFIGSKLEITTRDIIFRNRTFLGPYKAIINSSYRQVCTGNGSFGLLLYHAVAKDQIGSQFMHIRQSGHMCLGGYEQPINKFLYQRDYLNLTNHIIMYLEVTYDINSCFESLNYFKRDLYSSTAFQAYRRRILNKRR